MKNRICLLLLSVSVFLLSNCASLNSVVQEPKVSFNSVELSGFSFKGLDLIAHIDVENPNAISIPLPKIDWQLFINTASFINGTLKENQSIKSRGKATLAVPVRLTYDGLYNSFKSLIETKEAAYDIAMGITFAIPILGDKVYNLDFSGVLPLPQLPKLSPADIKFSKVDFSGVSLYCDINVENPNKFPIDFPGLEWNYGINGIPLLSSSYAGGAAIAAGAAGVARIAMDVSYADVFKAVSSLKTRGEAKTDFAVGYNSQKMEMPAAVAGDDKKNALNIPISLPILQKPEVSFQGIAKKSLGLTMEFIASWEINNTNTFDCAIDEFNYALSVNNSSWAQGKMNNLPKIKAGTKTVIPLTISVSAVSMVMELMDIINRGTSVNYNCVGNMNFSADLPGLDNFNLPLDLKGSTKIR